MAQKALKMSNVIQVGLKQLSPSLSGVSWPTSPDFKQGHTKLRMLFADVLWLLNYQTFETCYS